MQFRLSSLSSLWALACSAALLLGVIGCSKQGGQQYRRDVDVNAMIQQLQDSDSQVRVQACVALSEAGPYAEAAVPALTEALKDRDPLVQRLAAYALGNIGPKAASAIPELKNLLGAGEQDLLTSAINAIRSIDPTALPDASVPNVATPVE
jgi:HEAT repeat protein